MLDLRHEFEPRYADPESGHKFLSCWFSMYFPAPCLTILYGFRRLTLPSCCQVLRLAIVRGSVRAPRAGSDPGREGRFRSQSGCVPIRIVSKPAIVRLELFETDAMGSFRRGHPGYAAPSLRRRDFRRVFFRSEPGSRASVASRPTPGQNHRHHHMRFGPVISAHRPAEIRRRTR